MVHRIIASVTLLSAGCSFAFGGGPPTDHQQMPYFDCPSTFGLPVADGFFASNNLVAAAAVLSQSKKEYADKNSGANRNVAAAASLAGLALFGASAIYGIVQANRCSTAKKALEARIMEPILDPPHRPTPARDSGAPASDGSGAQQPVDGGDE